MNRLLLLAALASPLGAQARTLRVVATTTDLASVAREVAGDKAAVESLAPPVANPHFVDAKPSYIVKLMKADLFLQTGLELESGWAPVLLQGARNKDLMPGGKGHLDASEAVEPIEVPKDATRAMGDVHPGGNPHYMADPENARKVARAIARRLAALAPEEAASFEAGLKSFESRLDEALARWSKALAPLKGARFVSYHRDWNYFALRFGLAPAGEIEPKPGIPPTPSHTAGLIESMKAQKVGLIFNDPWYEDRTPASIAKETGARVLDMALYPGGRKGTEGGYIACMDHNVRQLAGAP